MKQQSTTLIPFRNWLIAGFIATLSGMLAFTACDSDKEVSKVISLASSQTSFVQGGSVNFTVLLNEEEDVTSQAVITETGSGAQVSNATWTSDTPGTYVFKATYEGVASNNVTITVTEQEVPIAFAPAFAASVQAAPSQIGVFGFDTGAQEWSATATPNLMYNQLLIKEGEQWVYEPVQNWPLQAKTSFFAYAPYASADNGIVISTQSATGAPVLTYELPSGDDCHTDIMIATPRLDLSASEEPVGMEFRSVMTRIGFRIKGQGEQISKIAIRGILAGGSIALNATNQGTSTWVSNGNITLNEFEAGLVYDNGQEYVTATETMTNVTAEDGYLYLMPQNVHYEARIVVTIDGMQIGFPIESALQWMPGEEYIFDLTIPSAALDYTDNASPALLIASLDGAAAQNTNWTDAMAGCSEGYRLPTYNEGILIMLYMNGIANNSFRYASYWTSTEHTELDWQGDKQSKFYDPFRNVLSYSVQYGLMAFRCVGKVAPVGKKYPYIDDSDAANGPIIVSRDANGGARPSAMGLYDQTYHVFHDNWTTTPNHSLGGSSNLISRKLQVANADLSDTSQITLGDFTCPDGWRTPTMRELMLIYIVGGSVSDAYVTDDSSPYYNPVAIDSPMNNVSGFTPLKADSYWTSTTTDPGRGGSTNPMSVGMHDGSTKILAATETLYARCVRDVE